MSDRHDKPSRNGPDQTAHIPREFDRPAAIAMGQESGQRLIIESLPPQSLLAILASMEPLDEDFPFIEDRPAKPVDL